jgi:hypothetical protein
MLAATVSTIMKPFDSRFIGACFGSLLFCSSQFSVAQGTLNALTYAPYPGGDSYSQDIVAYGYSGDVGWSFVPTSDMQVTAILSFAPQVSFWLGTNQLISTYNITASPTSFQTVPSLLLSAGQMYSVSIQCTNAEFAIYPLGTGTDDASFAISSYITEFESFIGAPSSQVGATSSSLFGGPDFQFQVVPLLKVQKVTNTLILSWTDPSSKFSLQSAANVTGNFTNVVGAASPYTNNITGSQMFYRLQAN